MNNKEFVSIAENILKYDTIYVMGCFGAPMTKENKDRYINHHAFNRRDDRKAVINNSNQDTFGFDCVGVIKGILWGWNAKTPSYYGGADYQKNDIPDIDANRMLDVCNGVSRDFSNIQVGEALGMKDHIGIYIGNGMAIESTHRWSDGVQKTNVYNVKKIEGANGRYWERHGKLPWVEYEDDSEVHPDIKPDDSLKKFIMDVQRVTGSVVDGVAGNQTINNTVTVSRWKNDTHPVVKILQERLYNLGYVEVGKADGVTGPRFDNAVKRYQKDNDCYIDGIITARNKTWRKLLGMED